MKHSQIFDKNSCCILRGEKGLKKTGVLTSVPKILNDHPLDLSDGNLSVAKPKPSKDNTSWLRTILYSISPVGYPSFILHPTQGGGKVIEPLNRKFFARLINFPQIFVYYVGHRKQIFKNVI